MSKTDRKKPWGKFYWNDWRGDECLAACGLAARGLWMEMLCIMAKSDLTGYLTVGGNTLEITALARMVGSTESEINPLLDELERNGVFSRNAKGVIYSRRMVHDEKRHANDAKNGKTGGNPSLLKGREKHSGVNPSHKPPDKGAVKAQRPEARGQNKKDNTQPLLPDMPGKVEDESQWWFKGTVIRLNRRDYEAFCALGGFSDKGLQEYLTSRDEWISRQAEGVQKRWFNSTQADLKRIQNGGRHG